MSQVLVAHKTVFSSDDIFVSLQNKKSKTKQKNKQTNKQTNKQKTKPLYSEIISNQLKVRTSQLIFV